jgi:hypothetical protein
MTSARLGDGDRAGKQMQFEGTRAVADQGADWRAARALAIRAAPATWAAAAVVFAVRLQCRHIVWIQGVRIARTGRHHKVFRADVLVEITEPPGYAGPTQSGSSTGTNGAPLGSGSMA